MRSRRLLAAVVLAMLAALVLALPASAGTPAGGTCGGTPLATFEATLTGEQEISEAGDPNAGDPDGRGRAVVEVYKKKVCFTLRVRDIETPTGAHIHLGLPGENGPIVATLDPLPPEDGSSSGRVEIPRALSLELMEHPRRYYVNVHNNDFPLGAIRGQLHR